MEAVSAAGPAVELVMSAIKGAVQVVADLRAVGPRLAAIATEAGALFDLISAGLADLLGALLAADDRPLPDGTKRLLLLLGGKSSAELPPGTNGEPMTRRI